MPNPKTFFGGILIGGQKTGNWWDNPPDTLGRRLGPGEIPSRHTGQKTETIVIYPPDTLGKRLGPGEITPDTLGRRRRPWWETPRHSGQKTRTWWDNPLLVCLPKDGQLGIIRRGGGGGGTWRLQLLTWLKGTMGQIGAGNYRQSSTRKYKTKGPVGA